MLVWVCRQQRMDLVRLLAVVFAWSLTAEGQQDAALLANECVQHAGCSSCIQSPGCFWCARTVFPRSRCLSSSALEAGECPEEDRQDPESHVNVTVEEDTMGKVQVRPHRVDATLNPGHKESFTVTVTPAPDIPLDVYILMDFSASTRDDLQVLQQIAHQIADTIAAITPNYRLGFGTFVDKPLRPYQYLPVDFWTAVCSHVYLDEDGLPCAVPYSFKHSLPLVDDAEEFRDTVLREISSFNLDFPEGGLDGLVQVMACKDIIGWRDGARHVVLFLTDAGVHLAYDGKLVGVVKPNPGQCLLNSSAPLPIYYEHSEEYDYPSVAQIYSLMTENDIIPIFACTEDFLPIYEELVQFLPGSSATSLYSNSSNLLDLIRTEYHRITHTVGFVYTTVPGLSVDVEETVCPEGATLDPDSPATCLGVEINQTVIFNVTVTVTEVTEELVTEGEGGIILRIPFFEDIVFFVKPIQRCNCEDNPEIQSAACSAQGSLVCGECHCDPGFAGTNCSCPVDQTTSGSLSCPTGPSGVQCSGRGECSCGVCVCSKLSADQFYYGTACECSNFNCALDTFGRQCSGHGTCGCNGDCLCGLSPTSGLPYTGEICDCSPDITGCIHPVDSLRRVCGGVGECVCEECKCQEGYSGMHCEYCDSTVIKCTGQQTCRLIGQQCLQCALEVVGRRVVLGENSCNHTNCPNITFVNTTLPLPEGVEAYKCGLAVSGGQCSGVDYYIPASLEDQGRIIVHTTPTNCAAHYTVPAWQIAVPTVVVAVLFGIMLIVGIKLCVVFYDCWEYRKWRRLVAEEDHSTMENPLYEGLHKEVVNPLFEDADDELEDTRLPVHIQRNLGFEDDDFVGFH